MSGLFCENCGRAFDAGHPGGAGGCRCTKPMPDEDGYCEVCGLKTAAPATPAAGFEDNVGATLAVASDKGRRHPTNQDGGGVRRRPDGTVLLVVADGVSVSDRPEAASAAAVLAAEAAFASAPGDAPVGDQAFLCVEAAARAVTALKREAADGPASTIVVAVLSGAALAVAWVGDSRAYLVQPGTPATLLTRDDSWCMEEVDAGRLTYEAAQRDANAHAITQWLGMPLANMAVHVRVTLLPSNTDLLLCSDGLWNYVDDPERLGLAYTEASKGADALVTCRRLVAFANAAGGRDNVTVALGVRSRDEV